jgi:hypothetical protein
MHYIQPHSLRSAVRRVNRRRIKEVDPLISFFLIAILAPALGALAYWFTLKS